MYMEEDDILGSAQTKLYRFVAWPIPRLISPQDMTAIVLKLLINKSWPNQLADNL